MSPVVLFYSRKTASDVAPHHRALAGQGYELRHCPDTAALRFHLRRAVAEASQSGEPVMAVLAAAAPDNSAAASILAAAPHVGVLAQIDACDDATLAATLQLGVDAWCPRACSPQVLALALHGLKRRLERHGLGLDPVAHSITAFPAGADAASPPPARPGSWTLRDHAWLLQTPAGRDIRLTSSERDFLLRLLSVPDKTASHADLLRTLGRLESGDRAARSRLGVLVSRLRRKVADQGAELPIQSLHNWGYMFAGDIQIWNASPGTAPAVGPVAARQARSPDGRRLKTMLSR